MTDDITRGLTLLADEAEPASVNTDEVITRARARTRNRRATTTTAIATLVVISALVVTLSDAGPPSEPTTSTTRAESLVNRLNRQLTEALPGVIPAGWSLQPKDAAQDPPLRFVCGITVIPAAADQDSFPNGCSAYADYRDGIGEVQVQFKVDRLARNLDDPLCEEQYCTLWGSPDRQELSDGTRTQVTTYTEKMTSRDIQELVASRPDGTQIGVAVIWPQGQRSKSALTTEAILKLATAFTYLPQDVPLPESPKTDPKKAARLTGELNDVLGAVIPAGWSRMPDDDPSDGPPFNFDCSGDNGMSCWTAGYYRDAAGTEIGIKFSVAPKQVFSGDCYAADCVTSEKVLADGTRTELKFELLAPITTYTHTVSAFRPDGTVIWVEVFWKGQPSPTPLTDEQLLEFATAFTF